MLPANDHEYVFHGVCISKRLIINYGKAVFCAVPSAIR